MTPDAPRAPQDDMKIEAFGDVILPADPRHPRYSEFTQEDDR